MRRGCREVTISEGIVKIEDLARSAKSFEKALKGVEENLINGGKGKTEVPLPDPNYSNRIIHNEYNLTG